MLTVDFDRLGLRPGERVDPPVGVRREPVEVILCDQAMPGMNGPVPLAGFAGRFADRERRYDARCEPFAVEDSMTIELPAAKQVLYVPKNLSIRQDGLDYQATYSRDGMRYHLARRVMAGNPRGWCTPQEYQALRPAMNRISRAMHGRLVFVLNDTDVAAATVKQ